MGDLRGRVGVSWTGPGVITLIDTSPHTHAHVPRGPIRGLALQWRDGWKVGTGAAGECIRGVIALLIFVYPCVTPPDAPHPPLHQQTHTHTHTQPINPTGPIESSVPLKAFRAPVFYTPNIIMHRGARLTGVQLQ